MAERLKDFVDAAEPDAANEVDVLRYEAAMYVAHRCLVMSCGRECRQQPTHRKVLWGAARIIETPG